MRKPTKRQVEFLELQKIMMRTRVFIVPALRDCLGEHFEQEYPANGEHKDDRVFLRKEIADLWRSWQAATHLWRETVRVAQMERNWRNYPGGGNDVA